MKKGLAMILCGLLLLAAAGCGNANSTANRNGNQTAGVQDVLEAKIEEAEAEAAPATEAAPTTEPVPTIEPTQAPAEKSGERQSGVDEGAPKPEDLREAAYSGKNGTDVDLTVLTAPMVYSEVYAMMTEPDDYIGKTVKMFGKFAVYHDEATGNDYFACVIKDATACCSQGIEFILAGDYSYPEDYPKLGENITVLGLFDTYLEDGYTFCTLRDAKLL